MVHFKEWSSEDVRVQLSWFDNGTEVIEAQAFIHVIRQSLPFSQQLQVDKTFLLLWFADFAGFQTLLSE